MVYRTDLHTHPPVNTRAVLAVAAVEVMEDVVEGVASVEDMGLEQ
jgi:hypothetical protein